MRPGAGLAGAVFPSAALLNDRQLDIALVGGVVVHGVVRHHPDLLAFVRPAGIQVAHEFREVGRGDFHPDAVPRAELDRGGDRGRADRHHLPRRRDQYRHRRGAGRPAGGERAGQQNGRILRGCSVVANLLRVLVCNSYLLE